MLNKTTINLMEESIRNETNIFKSAKFLDSKQTMKLSDSTIIDKT